MESIERAIAENKLQEAEKLCDTLLKHSEYDITGLYYKAIIMRKQDKLNLALEIQNTLINLLPRTAEYYAERGLTYHYLKEHKVALVPGSIFGDNGEGYLRLSFAASTDELKEGLARIRAGAEALLAKKG